MMTENLLELFCCSTPCLLLLQQQADRLEEGRSFQWSEFSFFVYELNLCPYCLLADLFARCLKPGCCLSRVLNICTGKYAMDRYQWMRGQILSQIKLSFCFF